MNLRVRRELVQWAAVGGAVVVTLATLADTDVAGLSTIGPGGPAAAGMLLLAGSVGWPRRAMPAALTALAAVAAAIGVLAAAGDGGVEDLVGGLVVAALLVVPVTRAEADGGAWPGVVLLAGSALAAVGALSGIDDDVRPALLAAAGAVVVGAAGIRPRRGAVVLLPAGLALGVPSLATLDDAPTAVAVVLLVGAGVLAVDRWRAGAALAFVALAAATVDGALAAAWLLAAAAVLASVAATPVAAIAAVPGAASLVSVLVDEPGGGEVALLGLLAVVAALSVVAVARREGDPTLPPVAAVVAAVASAWLLVAPDGWGWAGDPGLRGWRGGGLAAVVAAGAVLLVVAADTAPALRLGAPDPPPGRPDSRRAGRALVAMGALAAVAGVALAVDVLV